MKSFRYIICALTLLSASATYAENSCCPPQDCTPFCNPCETCSDWKGGVYADLLYWKVCRPGLDAYFDNESEKVKLIEPSYDLGFRLGGDVQLGNCNQWTLGLRYTHYDTSETKKLQQPCLYEDSDSFEFSKALYKLDLDVLDLEAGYDLKCNCNEVTIHPFFGVKFTWIDEKYRSVFFNDTHRKLESDGVGIYMGTFFEFPISCGFSVVTRGSVAILDTSFTQKGLKFDDSGYDVHNECIYVPALEGFIGANYSSDYFNCGTLNLAIGYEANWYGWRELVSSDDITFLGLGGLTVRLGFGF